MARRLAVRWRRWRWVQGLVVVVVMLCLVSYQNMALHRRGNAETRTGARLNDLALLLHEESDLQWKTLADRSAPARVAREVGAIRAHERDILDALIGTLPDGMREQLEQLCDAYHSVLDQELALLAVSHSAAALALEWRATQPQFQQLSQTISRLAGEAVANAGRSSRTADLTLAVTMVLTAAMIGALLLRFERAHQAAVRAGAELLTQERNALAQANESAATIRHQAQHDALTGLPNRILFVERVEQAMRAGGDQAVLFVDLDDFKRVNDSLGHAAGDELLVAVARRLRASLRDTDTAARLGGDEFAVLVHDGGVELASKVASRIIAALREPVEVSGTRMPVQASVGIATALQQRDTDALLRNADVAMYAAKEGGKGRFAVFEPAMHDRLRDRVGLEADLRRALERGELVLAYQPLVSLADGGVVGAEALVRWQHPTRGLLSPAAFLPVAEESGLILPLGRWVLREACRQVGQWTSGHGGRRLPISVNLSAHQLHHPGLVDEVVGALADTGLDPGALVLEVTESAVLRDHEVVAARLGALRARGVRIALDDFGTGYSSLSHLLYLPVDQLKIDRSFVRADDAIVAAILQLGQRLGLEVVAEGVETQAQAERLLALGCQLVQGYHFGRPQPAADFAGLLEGAAPASPVGATRRRP
jgi:diguanylate cyclase (GGDEF)-like protein